MWFNEYEVQDMETYIKDLNLSPEVKTAHDLFLICERDYPLTMKAYYSLKKNGIMFEDWEDKYLFEVLSKKTSSLMWQKYEIVKVSQFVDYSEAQLEEIISLYPKLSRIVKTRLQEH